MPTATQSLFLALQNEPAASEGLNPLVLMLGVLAIFWFVAIMPERKQRKKKQAMIDALKKNDRVLTTGGMFARVAAIGEQDITIKFDDGPTRVRLLRSGIASVIDGSDGQGES